MESTRASAGWGALLNSGASSSPPRATTSAAAATVTSARIPAARQITLPLVPPGPSSPSPAGGLDDLANASLEEGRRELFGVCADVLRVERG